MFRLEPLAALALAALFGFASCARSAESSPGTPMKMDEPMPTKMMKPGMRKRDVKQAAEKKEREMKAMMEKESAGGAKK